MPTQKRIAIAGAGIAGLTAAFALSKQADGASHQITLYERAETLQDVGAGIQLSPNASRCLIDLGLGDKLSNIALEPKETVLISGGSGRILTRLPFKSLMRERYGAPYYVVHRGDLQKVLIEAVSYFSNIELKTGTFVEDYAIEPDGKVALTLGGNSDTESSAAFDALLISDGVRSNLRDKVSPGTHSKKNGQTAWRASVPFDAEICQNMDKSGTSLVMSRNCHAVIYPMGTRDFFNIVLVTKAGERPTADIFKRFVAPWQNLFASVENWLEWPIRTVNTGKWIDGPVALLGDAAHAMSPHAAQGGAMAIEDAIVMAAALNKYDNPRAALAHYQSQRKGRVARVMKTSEENCRIYQLGGPAALARNMALRAAPPAALIGRLDWLYKFNA